MFCRCYLSDRILILQKKGKAEKSRKIWKFPQHSGGERHHYKSGNETESKGICNMYPILQGRGRKNLKKKRK